MRRSSAPWRIVALAAVLALSIVQPGTASTQTPMAAVQSILAEASQALTDPSTQDNPEAQVRALVGLLERVVAFPEAAELALGAEWSARSAAERAEFLALFVDMVERSFVMTVASRAKVEGGLNVRYLSESVRDDHAAVRVTMTGRDDSPIPVEFRMMRRGDSWAIRDLAIEGIGFMKAFRAQVRRVRRDSSYEGLIARMRARNIDAPAWWAGVRQDDRRTSAATPMTRTPPRTAADGPAPPTMPSPTTTRPAPTASPAARATSPPQPRQTLATSSAPPTTSPERDMPTVLTDARITTPPGARHARGATASSIPAHAAVQVSLIRDREAKPPSGARPSPGQEAPSPGAIYWVQIGLYQNGKTAIKLLEELLVRKLPVDIAPVTLHTARGEISVTRLRVGPYVGRQAAAVTLGKLKRAGYSPILGPEVPGRTAPAR